MYGSRLFRASERGGADYGFEIFLSKMQRLKSFKILSVTSFYETAGFDKGLNIFVCYECNESETTNERRSEK